MLPKTPVDNNEEEMRKVTDQTPPPEKEKLKLFLNACANELIAQSHVDMSQKEAIEQACQEQYRYLKIARTEEEKESIDEQLKLLEQAKNELIKEVDTTPQEEADQKKKQDKEEEDKKKRGGENADSSIPGAASRGIDSGGYYVLAGQEDTSSRKDLLDSDRNIILSINTFQMGISQGESRDLPPRSVSNQESTFQIQKGVNATVVSQGVHREMRLEISGKLSSEEKETMLKKAQKMMQERNKTGNYHLTDNNCVRTVKEVLHEFAPDKFSKEADMFGMHLPGFAGKLDKQVSAAVKQQMQMNQPAIANGQPKDVFGAPVSRPTSAKTAEMTQR